jgi:hypothetical protein
MYLNFLLLKFYCLSNKTIIYHTFRAIAASAPVFWFRNSHIPEDIFDRIVTRTFVNSGCNLKNILTAWRSIQLLAKTGKVHFL